MRNPVKSTHLDFDYQGVDGGVQLLDLLAHLLLALLQAGHHLVEATHPVLQAAHFDQPVDAAAQTQNVLQVRQSILQKARLVIS